METNSMSLQSKVEIAKKSLEETRPAIVAEKIVVGKYDDTELRNLIKDLSKKIEELSLREDRDTIYDDSEIKLMLGKLSNLYEELSQREDKDTIYDDTKIIEMLNNLRNLYEELSNREDKDTVYDDTELRQQLYEMYEELSKKEDKDTVYDDTEIRGLINNLKSLYEELSQREDKDTVYDDTKIKFELSDLGARIASIAGLTNVSDLTSVFKTGDAVKINEALRANATKLVYVAAGDYNLNGTIFLGGVTQFYCFGNLIGPSDVSKLKPMSEYWPGTLYKNDVIRALVVHNGTGPTCYINKITVKHNYCAFYVYFGKLMNITINTITGVYPSVMKSEYKSVFNSGVKFTSKTTRYSPISDEWYLNSGFMTDHIADSVINIGGIDNLNYGINFIETIPDKAPAPYTGINFSYIEIMCNRFNINSIVCKKAISFDFDHAIEWKNNQTVYASHSSSGNNIHGNVFTICGFDYTTAKNTNSIETVNDSYYNQEKDNRRIMFNIIGKSNDKTSEYLSNNTFNVSYYQGIYDVVVNANNVSNLVWNGYLQPNDVYFNDGTSHSQRNKIKSTYIKGTSTGYEEGVTINISPILIFNNCYSCEFNNIERAFIRPNEIQVTNSKNIRIKQVDSTDSGDFYHRVLRTNIANIKERIYDDDNIYVKGYTDGYTKL